MEDGAELVRFQNVGMRYGLGPEVLHDVSFRLTRGSFHFLTGPSGAGKSSLLRLMYLACRPSRGLVTLFGNMAPDGAILKLSRSTIISSPSWTAAIGPRWPAPGYV